MFRPICPPAFFKCFSKSGTYMELQTMSFIESTGITCSDSISPNQVQVLSIPALLLILFRIARSKSWQQHPTRHQLYGHLPPITKTIQVRRTRHAGHCWRSRDELIRDVLLWIPTHGRAKAGRPARTYIQQLCEDTGCCPEDLPRAMNDREEWRERVRDICAASTRWWWWWWLLICSQDWTSNLQMIVSLEA